MGWKNEVQHLMSWCDMCISRSYLMVLDREKVRISLIGDCTKLSKPLQRPKLRRAARGFTSFLRFITVVKMISCKLAKISHKTQRTVSLNQKTSISFYSKVNWEQTAPSCELRISNFLLWELAYTELCFINSFSPDFGEDEFVKALSSYQRRQRRYGGRSS